MVLDPNTVSVECAEVDCRGDEPRGGVRNINQFGDIDQRPTSSVGVAGHPDPLHRHAAAAGPLRPTTRPPPHWPGCIGDAARVPGMTTEPATVDVGMGMDPGQAGRGYGAAFGQTVLKYLSQSHPSGTLRAVVSKLE
jgi:hypothetical protein